MRSICVSVWTGGGGGYNEVSMCECVEGGVIMRLVCVSVLERGV